LMLGTADESPEAEHARSLLDERYLARSHALLALARRLHCRDHDELWEHLVEAPHRGASLRQHVERVYAWCRLARVDADPDATELEGTREREREIGPFTSLPRLTNARTRPKPAPLPVPCSWSPAVITSSRCPNSSRPGPSVRRAMRVRSSIAGLR